MARSKKHNVGKKNSYSLIRKYKIGGEDNRILIKTPLIKMSTTFNDPIGVVDISLLNQYKRKYPELANKKIEINLNDPKVGLGKMYTHLSQLNNIGISLPIQLPREEDEGIWPPFGFKPIGINKQEIKQALNHIQKKIE